MILNWKNVVAVSTEFVCFDQGPAKGFCERGNETSRCIKGGEFAGLLTKRL